MNNLYFDIKYLNGHLPGYRRLASASPLFLAFFALAALFPSLALSEDSFSEKVGRPVSISTFQAPLGFRDELNRIDTRSVVDSGLGWRPFRSADVWIFFILDEREVSELGGGVGDLYYSRFSESPSDVFSQRIDIEISSVRKIMLLFFFAREMRDSLDEARIFSCKSAVSAMSEISGAPLPRNLKTFFNDCNKGKY